MATRSEPLERHESQVTHLKGKDLAHLSRGVRLLDNRMSFDAESGRNDSRFALDFALSPP